MGSTIAQGTTHYVNGHKQDMVTWVELITNTKKHHFMGENESALLNE